MIYKTVCFHCRKLITTIDYKMVALERPIYANLFFHKDCRPVNLVEYIQDNFAKIEEYDFGVATKKQKRDAKKEGESIETDED